MPKIGMQPIRMNGLVEAAIMEIGATGSLDITVSQIARRAGVSSALAHHYFGTKERLFLSAMRHILSQFGAEVRSRLAAAKTPGARLDAIIEASFDDLNFRPEVVSAWLNFYVRARSQPDIAYLLSVYRRRLRSNLVQALRAGGYAQPEIRAEAIAAMIDGLYLRQSLAAKNERSSGTLVLKDYISLLPKEPT
ncbi:choline-binding transcriptional repressor BetI [Halovulum sp. GXIMD14794]